MPKKEYSKAIKRPANNPILEMTNDELEQLLNAELDKPADEMNTDLIEEILKAMRIDEPSPARKQADYEIARQYLPHRRARWRTMQAIIRFGAVAAVLIAIVFVPLRDAQAFRWTLISKILKPVAETFGIIIDDQTDITPEESEDTLYSVEDAPSTTIEYALLEDVPETAHGYLIRPKWIPEGFSLTSGSLYSSVGVDIYTMDFMKGEKWFNFYIHVLTDDETIYSYEFERNLDTPIEIEIGQHVVTFYSNRDDKLQSAFWIHEDAYYRLFGDFTVDEAISFIEHME